ncbi:MAG: hypothetical protein ACE5HL_07690 [Terriglobia bacterium]
MKPERHHWYLVAVAAVSLVVGYFAGREHVKYEIRSAMQDALSGVSGILGGAREVGSEAALQREEQQKQRRQEVEAYRPFVELYDVGGGYRKGKLKCWDRPCPAVWGKARNRGNRTLEEVKVTAYFPDKEGNVIFEKEFHPVLVTSLGSDGGPLKPGYIREFGYVVEECPSECVPRRVSVVVTDLKFSEEE